MNIAPSTPATITPDHPALLALAEAPVLLVVSDFDGTLSPIAPRPGDARADLAGATALRGFTRSPRTYAAVLSGRSIDELRGLLGTDPGVLLVGSHGAEWEDEPANPGVEEIERIGQIRAEVRRIAAAHEGALCESKPFGAALHMRCCAPEVKAVALAAARAGPWAWPGVHAIEGHDVVEFAVRPQDKGGALAALRRRIAATHVLFIGDDATDERAFASMPPGDLSVKVGPGATSARFRVAGQHAVAPLLEALRIARARAIESTAPRPITAHALLSDQRSVALVDDRGSVQWMCLPQADSGSLFGGLLGSRGGRFAVHPEVLGAEPVPPGEQQYEPDSMVLRTEWPGLRVFDYLDCSGGRAFQRSGRTDLIRVVEGTARCRVSFEPRPDFGRGAVTITPFDEGLRFECGPDVGVLRSPGVRWEVASTPTGASAHASIDPTAGPVVFELRWGLAGAGASVLDEPERRRQTIRFWNGWASSLRLPEVGAEDAKRSALVLKALCHGPTGAILAAATTSLPEQFGGVRNWDYRFCWPRDACLSARAMLRLGNTGVPMKLLDWLVGVVATAPSPDRLRPIYTVSGTLLSPEAEITALEGYDRSAPVRIGNAADAQVQLDVFGPIVDLVAALAETGSPVTPDHWRLVRAMVEAVELRWREPDHGIWEIRGPKQRHVHSAVMCWLAATRGAQIAREVVGQPRPSWEALAAEIKADLLANGFNTAVGAFTTAYGSAHLDAAALWAVISGLLPPDDPRAVSTVRAVQRLLLKGPVVMRYRFDDGLPGIEGGFVIAAFWLAECLWMIGDREAAVDLFHRARDLKGPTGLLAEQHDPVRNLPLGNYPQAYSHLGLINAACRLSGRP